MREAVAIFDLDGTITRGDTYLAFLAFLLRRMPHRWHHTTRLPGDVIRFKLGLLSNDELKAIFLTTVAAGLEREPLSRHVEAFLPDYMRRMVKPRALERIEWHRKCGHRLILASASLDIYAERFGARLRFTETISTHAAFHDNALTGALDGPNLRGEAKLAAVRAAIGAVPPSEVYAYSDHWSDLPLLTFFGRPVVVDPDRTLRRVARIRNLPIERWR